MKPASYCRTKHAIIRILGPTAALSLFLAFVAPAWYQRWRGFSPSTTG